MISTSFHDGRNASFTYAHDLREHRTARKIWKNLLHESTVKHWFQIPHPVEPHSLNRPRHGHVRGYDSRVLLSISTPPAYERKIVPDNRS